jgi:NADPH2:quinone reductase
MTRTWTPPEKWRKEFTQFRRERIMKAILCLQPGPPEALKISAMPDPKPGKGEVVVDVAFAALNFFDTLIIQNRYQVKPACPF